MSAESEVLMVQVFAAPAVSCCGGSSWEAATGYLRQHLERRFGKAVAVEFIEMFSPRSFEFPDVLKVLEQGGPLPMVRVGTEIVSQGGKLSESRIALAITANLERIRVQEND